MLDSIRLASIVEESIVDGPGLRFVLFTQGCPHRCRGCHNPQTFLSVGGEDFSIDELLALYNEHPMCRGMTFSGGEPFMQADVLAKLASVVHKNTGDVITYTGYRLEKLHEMTPANKGVDELLSETDLLIDGPYVQSLRCMEVPFVGSTNQRFISLSEQGNALLDEINIPASATAVKRIFFEK